MGPVIAPPNVHAFRTSWCGRSVRAVSVTLEDMHSEDSHDRREPPVQFAKPAAVIDSNVMLEAVSCVDLMKHYERADFDARSPDSTLRRQKARESLLLAIHLDRIGATTYSLYESARVTLREVDPDSHGAFENHAMKLWLHYVKDCVLPNWTMTMPSTGDEEPTGSRADTLLVERAKEFGVPLITHEGLTVAGIDQQRGIRRKARSEGVTIVTAREFYGSVNELLYSALFLQRFDQGAGDHIRASSRADVTRESMSYLRGYYLHILYGIANGEREPLPIRLSRKGERLTAQECADEPSL